MFVLEKRVALIFGASGDKKSLGEHLLTLCMFANVEISEFVHHRKLEHLKVALDIFQVVEIYGIISNVAAYSSWIRGLGLDNYIWVSIGIKEKSISWNDEPKQ